MKRREYLLAALLTVAASHSASAAHRAVGVVPADGGAQLVKKFSVAAGSTILGAEFESNDPRTVFPEVRLVRGGSTSLNEGVVVGTATDASGAVSGWVRVLWAQPVVVTHASEYHVTIRMPAGAEKRGPGDGPGIGADEEGTAGGSFLAGGPDGELVAIGVDLAIRLLTTSVGKAVEGEPGPTSVPRTFFRTAASNPAAGVVRFELGIEVEAYVTLDIYDVSGRLVRTIVRAGDVGPGIYGHTWDLRDTRGAKVPAGIYMAKARLGEQVMTEKIVLTR